MLYAIDIDEDTLRSRFLEPYQRGASLTSGGRSIPASQIDQVLVVETAEPVDKSGSEAWAVAFDTGTNRTDDFVTGPPGGTPAAEPGALGPGISRDPTRVMIVHGRNTAALNALRAYLQSLGLVPILWEDAIEETGEGSPHNLDAVIAAMSLAQAVVVLFTAEEEARLLSRFQSDPAEEDDFVGQPRPNVLVEAGMAIALGRERTILTRLGRIRGASDLDGLNAVNLGNDNGPRTALRRRLATAGCRVNDRTDYLDPAVAGDFEAALIA
jgi:predicted nucleotide-binding protein